MKKILLGTTAVVALATISTEAFAADKIKLELGGFMRHYVGVTNHDEVASNATTGAARGMKLGQFANSEVYFRGATTLDNGLSVSVDIQREADKSTAARNDVSSLTVSSDAMGAFTIGSAPHAGDDFRVGSPNAGNFDWGDTGPGWGQRSDAAGTASTAFGYSAGDITDMGDNSGKLKYVSPSFSGVNVFASYSAAEGSGASDARKLTRSADAQEDGYTYGVAYEGEVSGTSVSADLTKADFGGGTETIHLGLSVGMAGFTVGGGYADFNDTSTGTAATNENDGKAWELGVGYETGPYSLSASYMTAKNNGTAATAGNNKDTAWTVAATYDMGAGVALNATYFNSKADPEGTGTTFANGKSSQVNGLIAGIEVGF